MHMNEKGRVGPESQIKKKKKKEENKKRDPLLSPVGQLEGCCEVAYL
jgi:hypothetical protein